ncbi:MAG: ribbon-helix-helix protein, CopG family [Myxococcales bacterium]|nr:ribbon-helix-helix protein, CopG family [Myxococcales bacterium]
MAVHQLVPNFVMGDATSQAAIHLSLLLRRLGRFGEVQPGLVRRRLPAGPKRNSLRNMKTIAITIDEPTLEAVDRLAREPAGKRGATSNRSAVVRAAVREYLDRHAREEREAAEWRIWSKHLKRVNAEAAAMVSEQAGP